MNLYTAKIKLYLIAPLVFVFAFLFFLTPQASASIVVEGDREFTDEVNECLNTYRGAPGIVGDTIKELERSGNEHKITNSTDWTNTANNIEDAGDGDGTGSVTRVDKAEIERYKERFPELLNKDFCTGLLHELSHAADADRGERNPERVDGVKRNEIRATMFQNFVHAIRGVDPRTSYGGTDISQHVLIGGNEIEEIVEESEPEEEPEVAEPEPEPEPKTEVSVNTSFKHVAPGSYSEIYATVNTSPGASVKVTLSGPGVDSTPTQTVTADGKGIAKFIWKIVAYGNYTVSGTAGGDSISSKVNVE